MRSIFITACLLLFLLACKTVKESTNDTYANSVEDVYNSKYKEMYMSLRDSIGKIEAPKEISTSRGLMDSYLFTSLANSRAWIDSLGLLNHTLENRDSIPTKYIKENIYIYNTDTMYINKVDTLYQKIIETKMVELSVWDKLKNTLLGIGITMVVVICVGIVVYVKRLIGGK